MRRISLNENANVVRIMTIHKSKGLEFPICFVCGLAKQFKSNGYAAKFNLNGCAAGVVWIILILICA